MKLEKEKNIFENNFWHNYRIVLNLIVTIVVAGIVFIQGLHKILPFIILVIVGMIIILYLCNPKKQKNKKYTKVKDIEVDFLFAKKHILSQYALPHRAPEF